METKVDEDLLEKIRLQIEFYFSDSNFRKDKFLKGKAAADEAKEGYVPLSVLLTFNKLKTLTTDLDVVAKALKSSDSVTLSADAQKVKRSAELPENDDSAERTLYVKGYPIDDDEVTIDSVKERWSTYGKILMVKLRTAYETKKFKGSCFVEFDNKESVAKAVEDAYKGTTEMQLKHKEKVFDCVMDYKDWSAKKEAKKNKRKKEVEAKSSNKRKADKVEGEKETTAQKLAKVEFVKGIILEISNVPLGIEPKTLREDVFKEFGKVQYVEFRDSKTDVLARCATPEDAEALLKSLGEGKVVAGEDSNVLTGVLVEGEEEEGFWKRKVAKENDDNKKGKQKRGNGGAWGGKGKKFGKKKW